MELKRREHETSFEHKVRICVAKLNKEIDLDWHEIVDILSLDCSSDHLRKLSYSYKEYYDYLQELEYENVSEHKLLQQIEDKKMELEKERKKLQVTKAEYHKHLRTESRFDLLYENIKEAIKVIEPPKLFCDVSDDEEKAYILALSDIHFGAKFKSINNEYSIEECERRFNKLLSELRDYILDNEITTLTVLNNGDSLQGLLRISDISMNEIPVVESVVKFSQLMASFLNQLSQFCYVEYKHTPSANHTQNRLLNTKANELAREDMEKIIINYIADMLQINPRVDVDRTVDSDRLLFKVFDFDCIAMHGHQIKNIGSALKDLSMLHGKFFHYVFLGHTHSPKIITVGEGRVDMEVLVTPSFVGSCPYADSLMVGSKAMAKVYVFDKEKGHIETRNILLN